MWKIVSSAEGSESRDYRAWLHRFESERGGVHTVEARITRTALACSDREPPGAVAAAKQSDSRSAVEAVLSWARPPRLIVVNSSWINIFHRNGYCSRTGLAVPDDPTKRFESLVERAKIRVSFGAGVEHFYEYRGWGGWILQGVQGGAVRLEEPRMLSDVLAKLTGDQLQAALNLDPRGTSELAPTQLDETEQRVLRGLIEEMIEDSVEKIRIRLTRGNELTYEEVAQVLERLWIRGYVEEFAPGHWKATDQALAVQPRLLGTSVAA